MARKKATKVKSKAKKGKSTAASRKRSKLARQGGVATLL